jgi:hypothetical protein
MDHEVASMSARKAFYLHALVLVLLITTGMSERTPWLNWAKPLIILAVPLWLASVVMPAIIVRLATKEQQSDFRVSAAAILSIAMTISSALAILPLVQ